MSTPALAPTTSDQDGVYRSALSIYVGVLAGLADYVNEPGAKDPEVLVKIANSKLADVARVIPEKKADPYANLPTLHISIVNGSITTTVVTAAEHLATINEVVGEASEVIDFADLAALDSMVPNAAMKAAVPLINDDVSEATVDQSLDSLLGLQA